MAHGAHVAAGVDDFQRQGVSGHAARGQAHLGLDAVAQLRCAHPVAGFRDAQHRGHHRARAAVRVASGCGGVQCAAVAWLGVAGRVACRIHVVGCHRLHRAICRFGKADVKAIGNVTGRQRVGDGRQGAGTVAGVDNHLVTHHRAAVDADVAGQCAGSVQFAGADVAIVVAVADAVHCQARGTVAGRCLHYQLTGRVEVPRRVTELTAGNVNGGVVVRAACRCEHSCVVGGICLRKLTQHTATDCDGMVTEIV